MAEFISPKNVYAFRDDRIHQSVKCAHSATKLQGIRVLGSDGSGFEAHLEIQGNAAGTCMRSVFAGQSAPQP